MEVGKMFDEKLSRRGLLKSAAGAAGIAVLASGKLKPTRNTHSDLCPAHTGNNRNRCTTYLVAYRSLYDFDRY